MSYGHIEDSGEFNDSVVYLHPVRLTQKGPSLARPNPKELHLGIYEDIKLSHLLRGKQGKVVELVRLDPASKQAFLSEEGEAVLKEYATSEVALAVVAGNRAVGKSFFCDKVLNLSEVRGNHFCRSKGIGINMWSSPFEKGDLKIFLLEINGCDIQSPEFRTLLTYALMLASAFVLIDDLKPAALTALEQFDEVLAKLLDQLAGQGGKGYLPEFLYFLRRGEARKEREGLRVVGGVIEERLPDALAGRYEGAESEMMQLPFLDTKSIREDYVRRVASVFRQLHEVVTERRYNELTLTGNLILKIAKLIQTFLIGGQRISLEDLYYRVIEDLYQSAYNYCILSYHEEMERNFQDEQPKSLDQLLAVFEQASAAVLEKFQEFTLDDHFHQTYRLKLEKHIDEKEAMVLDINRLKTQRAIHTAYDAAEITDYESYKALLARLKSQHPNLTHGADEALGKLAAELMGRVKGVDYKSLKEVERLNATIQAQEHVLEELKAKSEQKSRERAQVNRQQEELYQQDKRLEARRKELRGQVEKAKTATFTEPEEMTREKEQWEESIRRNDAILNELRKGEPKKHKEVATLESKIQETERNIIQLEKILAEMRKNPPQPEEPTKQKEKVKEKRKK